MTDHKSNGNDRKERNSQNTLQTKLPERPLLRLFIGIPLTEATADSLASIAKRLQSQASSSVLRWSARESWHITLQFLGSSTPEQYSCITTRLRELRHASIEIYPGLFGSFDRAGVFYVDIRVTPQLTALQQAVVAATAPCGFVPEDRPYHPHITLARRKGKQGSREFRGLKLQIRQQPALPGFRASSFFLYESIPTPEGSHYEVREQFALDAV